MFDGIIMGWPGVLGDELQNALGKKVGPEAGPRGRSELTEEAKFGMFFQVGPQLPPAVDGDEWAVENHAGQCRDYLDSALREQGPNSVVYIR